MVIVACRKARPSLITGGVTEAMPCVAASAVLTWPALPAVAITSTGSPDPAGKCLASTFWAVIDGGVPRNDWATVSGPNLNPIRPSRADRQQDGGHHPHRARAAADGLADPGPRTRGWSARPSRNPA